MKFIKDKSLDRNNTEKEVCNQIWNILQGDVNESIQISNLKTFTAAIMNIQMDNETDTLNEGYGTFNKKGEFKISQRQMAKIHSDYNCLYLNRKAYNSPISKSVDKNDLNKKYSINECSIASKKLCKKSEIGRASCRERVYVLV